MLRYLKIFVLALLIVVLVSVALANRDLVVIELLPAALTRLFGFEWSLTLPLFMVVLGGVAVGLLIGFIWEWLREHKHRREAAHRARQAKQLEREVSRLKVEKHRDQDDVLALLDDTGRPAR